MDEPGSDYSWHRKFRELWENAAQLYEGGQRDARTFFSRQDREWLSQIGCSAQEMYDFAEDWCRSREPDYETALLITAARRDYFLTILTGVPAEACEPETTLPANTEQLGGITWLPRILEKAKRKLCGTLCDEIMYCCGRDREFLRKYDIHPADFLRAVWVCWDSNSRILAFVRDSQQSRAPQ